MNPHPDLERFLNWLLNHSAQAGALVLLVLLVQWIFRRRLTSRWRFALWWIVLARLLLPVGPQSAVSLFNYFHPPVSVQGPRYSVAPSQPQRPIAATTPTLIPQTTTSLAAHEPVFTQTEPVEPPATLNPARNPSPASKPVIPPHATNINDLILPIAIAIWLAGIVVLVMVVLIQILRFQWRLRHSAKPAAQSLQDLLRACQKEFDATRRIELLETEAVKSPALFGLFRLRLLLPKGFGAGFTQSELRYIFLHELAHVKRGDLWLNWLVTVLQITHWFNPLLWFGFARLRSDRELACDELALLRAGEKTGTSYGETVVKLLEGLSRPAAIPGLIGILEDKKQMRRRILMIANFKRPGPWSALAVLLLGLIAVAALTDAQTSIAPGRTAAGRSSGAATTNAAPKLLTAPNTSNLTVTLPDEEDAGTGPRPNLLGDVSAKDGKPLVGASVFIATAGPKTGTSTFCPSCYADCSKSAKTDSTGQFEINSLNPQLIFRVLAVAKGYKPKFESKVDPAEGPINIELDPASAADATPDRSLRGRVVDSKGKPVEGAVVSMEGVQTRDGGGSWGSLPGIDPLAVTDEKGEFVITSQKPFDMMDVSVEARGFAHKGFSKLSSGAMNELKLTEGATVTGRVLLNNKPLKDVTIGISGVDRQSGVYVGHFEVGTAGSGTFAFVNVPPDTDFYIYGLMSSLKNYGAISLQKFHSGKDGETTDIGELAVTTAHRLRGRIELSDGQPVPAKTRLLVSREEAWDSMQLTLDKNGGFDTTGLPEEAISLSARVKGYHISAQNKSVDRLNTDRLVGRVNRDITDLVYRVDKGPHPQPDYNMNIPESDWPQNKPLFGAEGGVDHSSEWTISGHVVDSETRQPLASFRVTPGYTDIYSQTGWNSLHAVQGTNGNFLTYVGKRVAQPLVKIEADGYLPASLSIAPADQTNADAVLTKGTGLAGFVLSPDGKPAAGASVALITEDRNQASLNSAGELDTYRNRSASTKTDADGHFSFKPELGVKAVAAASSNGFTMVTVDTLKTNSRITLQSFGRITGILKRPYGPATNEDLDLEFTDNEARGLPFINLNCHTITDSQGRFTFEGVPPAHLQLSYCTPINQQSWMNSPLQEVAVQPGQTVDLKVDAPEKSTNSPEFTQEVLPQAKRIPGEQIKGVVFSPNGKPVADADVALVVDNIYIALGKGEIRANDLRQQGLQVNSGKDGSFSLPSVENARFIIALNEEGFAKMSVEDFKASHKITLQKWGRIEGDLQINHHPGTNESVSLQGEPDSTRGIGLIYENSAFQARTDDQGHFVITFVPPGGAQLDRLIPAGSHAYNHRHLGDIDVKAGETTTVHFESIGRAVTGRIAIAGTNSPALNGALTSLNSIPSDFLAKLRTGTPEQRQAFIDSPEFKAAQKNARYFAGSLLADGSFRVEDVEPGKYYLDIQPAYHPPSPGQRPTNNLFYASAQAIIVPAGEQQANSTPQPEVVATSSNQAPTYQWYKNNTNNPDVTVGSSAPSTVAASGSPALFYQWHRNVTNTEAMPSQSTFDAGTIDLNPINVPAPQF